MNAVTQAPQKVKHLSPHPLTSAPDTINLSGVAEQHLAARADAGQQPNAMAEAPPAEMLEPPQDGDGEDKEYATQEVRDASYSLSAMRMDDVTDTFRNLQTACLPVLDIFVCRSP